MSCATSISKIPAFHVFKPGVAWEMDSVTNLPPGMILPVTILPPGRNFSVIHLPPPWQVYPHSKKRTRLLCFSHTFILNTFELIWIILEWFSDRSCVFRNMHIWKGLNVLVPVIPGALYVVFNSIRNVICHCVEY